MTGREKPKRKALLRGLDDIVNRDASLTSKLLGRVKPPARDPLEIPPDVEELRRADESSTSEEHAARSHSNAAQQTPPLRSHRQTETTSVRRIDSARVEVSSPTAPSANTSTKERESALEQEAMGQTVSPPISFDDFVSRWGFVLRSGGRAGKLRICQVLYENTFGAGCATFFTSYEKLGRLTDLEKKQCAINIKQLESLGFVERLNIYNTATRQGTEFKLHLEPLPPHARKAPRHHYYDEDVP